MYGKWESDRNYMRGEIWNAREKEMRGKRESEARKKER